LDLDWRSPAEFFGYVARVLEGEVPETTALEAWDSLSEKSWLLYTAGLILSRGEERTGAENRLKASIRLSEPDDWSYFLARARLETVQEKQFALYQNTDGWVPYRRSVEAFETAVQKDYVAKTKRRKKMEGLYARLRHAEAAEDKRKLFGNILELFPENGNAMARMAFYHAMQGQWDAALAYTQRYLKRPGRENAVRLGMMLLAVQIFHHQGNTPETLSRLKFLVQTTRDPLYRAIGECLLGKRTVADLKREAGESPENLMIVHYALGSWAEGHGRTAEAIRHYKVSLESLLDRWIEFEFSRERIKLLKKNSD